MPRSPLLAGTSDRCCHQVATRRLFDGEGQVHAARVMADLVAHQHVVTSRKRDGERIGGAGEHVPGLAQISGLVQKKVKKAFDDATDAARKKAKNAGSSGVNSNKLGPDTGRIAKDVSKSVPKRIPAPEKQATSIAKQIEMFGFNCDRQLFGVPSEQQK